MVPYDLGEYRIEFVKSGKLPGNIPVYKGHVVTVNITEDLGDSVNIQFTDGTEAKVSKTYFRRFGGRSGQA